MSDEQPKTTELPAADKNEILLAELKAIVSQGLSALDTKVAIGFGRLSADIGLVATDLTIVKDRVNVLETWKVESESRMNRTSTRVQSVSQADLEQVAQLAHERAAREELAKQVSELAETNATQLAILGRLDKVAANPLVKTICAMLATAFITWLATKGIQVPR